jgi:response regulator RpfG family c-di-GMP phosphodiesterase
VLKEVVPIVMAHHKYFATNPGAHSGENDEIPLGARIGVAVADSFDAMTIDRPYRKGMPPRHALFLPDVLHDFFAGVRWPAHLPSG